MPMILQVELLYCLFDDSVNLWCLYSFDQRVKFESFLYCELVKESIMLRTIADQISCICELSLYVITLNCDFTCRWSDISCQTLKSRRFTSSVDTKKSEALTVVETKGSHLDCFNWGTTCCLIFFLEITHSYTVISISGRRIRVVKNFWILNIIVDLGHDSSFFSKHIVIFRKDRRSLLSSTLFALAASQGRAPIEITENFKLNKTKYEESKDEVEHKNHSVTAEIIPGPDLSRNLSRHNNGSLVLTLRDRICSTWTT